jgi:hypothetical protein
MGWRGGYGGARIQRSHGLRRYPVASMQFSALSLFSAALYHMTEQHLIDLRQEILVDDGHDAVRPEAAIDWFEHEVGVDVKGLDSWEVIDELRLVANTVKHSEG